MSIWTNFCVERKVNDKWIHSYYDEIGNDRFLLTLLGDDCYSSYKGKDRTGLIPFKNYIYASNLDKTIFCINLKDILDYNFEESYYKDFDIEQKNENKDTFDWFMDKIVMKMKSVDDDPNNVQCFVTMDW